MKLPDLRRLIAAAALLAGGALVSAQGQLLPSYPKLGFGASVTPAYDGWYDNPDGSHTFLIGYYNRNWNADLDIPIGPNNRFEPGDPDRGQPTHFLPNRNFGMFSITVPKTFGATERLWWTLTINGTTSRVGMIMSPDFNITPQRASEEAPNGKYNVPPILRFSAGGPPIQNPGQPLTAAIARTATAGVPMAMDLFVEDDALYASGTNAPMVGRIPPVVTATVAKYRGPGSLKVEGFQPFTTLQGGKPMEPFSGRTNGTVTFSTAGDYVVHVTINDFSEKGGGATGCCWTTAMVKVNVAPGGQARTTGQH
ncbi:MAG TPA: hypothetical protein VM032_01000 [Vicinamibacterales bacterium]|nr:hypothetical protein [Vicinamibacterales bacterium]